MLCSLQLWIISYLQEYRFKYICKTCLKKRSKPNKWKFYHDNVGACKVEFKLTILFNAIKNNCLFGIKVWESVSVMHLDLNLLFYTGYVVSYTFWTYKRRVCFKRKFSIYVANNMFACQVGSIESNLVSCYDDFMCTYTSEI